MNQYHKTFIALSAFCALGLSSIRAEDNTTNIISGTLSDNGGANYVVGLTGINNYLRIDSGGQLVNANFVYIGSNTTANANMAVVTDSGSIFYATNQVHIGSSGDYNTLVVSNGGTFVGQRFFLGANAGSDYNHALITGTNSSLQVLSSPANNNVLVGRNGSFNSMIVSNGAAVGPSPGLGVVGNGATANDNWAVVTGPGSSWIAGDMGQVGAQGARNTLTVENGGVFKAGVSAPSTYIIVGNAASGANNSLIVRGTNSYVNSGYDLFVGLGGPTNSVTVADGGMLEVPHAGILGQNATSSGNKIVVSGAGSSWTNYNYVIVGNGGSGNSVVVSNGGTVLTYADFYVGLGGANNSLLVTGTNSQLEAANPLTIGISGTGHTATVANGGAIKVASVIMVAAGSRLNLNGGKLIAQGPSSAFINPAPNGNAYIQAGGAIFDSNGQQITIPTRLQEDPVSTGGGLTKTGAGTLLLSGTNTYTGSTIVESGTLGGNATLLSAALQVKSGAEVAPGSGIGTLAVAGPVTLDGGSTARMQISGLGAYDTVASSNTITLNGTLEVVHADTNEFSLGQAFVLFQSATGVTGDFTAINLPPLTNPGLAWKWVPTNGTLSVAYNGPATPTNMNYALSGNALTLSWPTSYQGWYVQSNVVSVADANAWFDIPNSQNSTNLVITVDPAVTNVFYRMRYP